MATAGKERRRFQRLKLAKPILGTLDGQGALILDVGVGGAFVEHYGRTRADTRMTLTFRWQGEDIEFVCEVARTTVARPESGAQGAVSHTGLRFVEGKGDADAKLQDMMATFIGRLLAAQRANSSAEDSGGGADILSQLGQARRLRTRGYMSYRLEGDRWSIVRTINPAQPPNGFTVAAYEDEEELETLCAAYKSGDEEARQMIRLAAELSVLSARK
jgi:hypothetical protein